MAKTLYSQSGKVEYGIKKYTVDTEADKEALNLRTAKMGSKCYVINTKKWYILNSSNQWVPFVDAGGSDGSPFNIKGSVATTNNLPSENNEIGDLYIVRENGSEWVWLTSENAPNGYWEQLGVEITADAVASAIGDMIPEQAAQTLQKLGGEQVFIVTLEDSSGVASTDKTFAEISAAKAAGMDVVLDLGICQVPLIQSNTSFYGSFVSDDGSVVTVITIEQTNTVNVDQYHMQYMTNTVNVTGSVPTINPQHNCMYICGTLTHLTISGGTVGAWSIIFTSGETPTTTTIPATILGLEDFAAEANTIYEINVLDNRAVVGSWAVSA